MSGEMMKSIIIIGHGSLTKPLVDLTLQEAGLRQKINHCVYWGGGDQTVSLSITKEAMANFRAATSLQTGLYSLARQSRRRSPIPWPWQRRAVTRCPPGDGVHCAPN